jgi:Cu(I)/Ag(I) efflux system membrane fusion protein/cobalt-zinc-cadmium efflux system membrane fusion protein
MATSTSTRIWIIVIVALAVGVVGYFVGRLTAVEAPEADTTQTTREIAYWRAPMDPTEIYDQPGKSAMGMDLVPVYRDELESGGAQAPGGQREIAYWRAPMDPTEIYDGPGKSAMNMDLIPVYADEVGGSSGGTITIDPDVVQIMGVRTGTVRREDFTRTIRTVGEVAYDEERLFVVNSKIAGWIERLYVNFVGDEVRAGQPLMEIYSPELVSTQEEYLLAIRNVDAIGLNAPASILEDAERLLAAARQRLEYWDIPASEIERLETTGQVMKTVRINAPGTGVVIERNVVQGSHIKPGQEIFRIADLRSVWVHASFYDNEIPWISVGQPVEMELSYLPGRVFEGRVSYVYPYLRERSRDVHVRLIFRNTSGYELKPGMYANVRLQGLTIPDALVIPSEAIIRSGERTLAFVVRGEGKFEPREIRIGEIGGSNNQDIRVLGGLFEGEEVVTSAQFLLDSESRLQEAIQKMLARRAGDSGDAPPVVPSPDAAGQDTVDHSRTDRGPTNPDSTRHAGHR